MNVLRYTYLKMEYSVNTRPLLEGSDSEEEREVSGQSNEIIINDGRPLFKPSEPRDKYYMAYLIFYLLGITTLLPWNFFITADDYWMYKFRDIKGNMTLLKPIKRSPLQASFTSYLSIASSVPSVAFLFLNTALNQRVCVHKRINGSLLFMLILFIVTTIFVQIDTDDWQWIFFVITLSIVVLLNIAGAILNGSLFGITGKFTPKYITAAIGGQALGGIFAALVQIGALAIGASSVHSAFVYFMVGNIMLFISLICYVVLSKTSFFKFHMNRLTVNEFENELLRPRIIEQKVIIRKILPYGVSVFLVFFISLCVFPGLTVLIESEYKGKGRVWNDTYFVPVTYLLFGTGDYIGRLLAGLIQKPRKGCTLVLFNIARIIFIPLLMLCNAQPRHNLPVIFDKDYYYLPILVFFAISNGYLANLSMICAPRVVEQHEKETASSIMTVFLGVGVAIGSTISLLTIRLL